MIVGRMMENIIRTVLAVLCNTIVHNHMHTEVTDMSSSYRRTVLGLGLCVLLGQLICVRVGYFVYLLFVTVWLSVPVQSTVWKDSSRNDLLSYTLTHSLPRQSLHCRPLSRRRSPNSPPEICPPKIRRKNYGAPN